MFNEFKSSLASLRCFLISSIYWFNLSISSFFCSCVRFSLFLIVSIFSLIVFIDSSAFFIVLDKFVLSSLKIEELNKFSKFSFLLVIVFFIGSFINEYTFLRVSFIISSFRPFNDFSYAFFSALYSFSAIIFSRLNLSGSSLST